MALLTAAASAVNYLGLQNAATSRASAGQGAGGIDTDISLMLVPKGTGGIQIYTGTGVHPTHLQMVQTPTLIYCWNLKGTGVVKANGVRKSSPSPGTQTLTLKTLTGPKIATIRTPAAAPLFLNLLPSRRQ